MKSVASDPWMAGMLGVNVPRLYAWIVIAGFFLAGLAGGLLLPNQTLVARTSPASSWCRLSAR